MVINQTSERSPGTFKQSNALLHIVEHWKCKYSIRLHFSVLVQSFKLPSLSHQLNTAKFGCWVSAFHTADQTELLTSLLTIQDSELCSTICYDTSWTVKMRVSPLRTHCPPQRQLRSPAWQLDSLLSARLTYVRRSGSSQLLCRSNRGLIKVKASARKLKSLNKNYDEIQYFRVAIWLRSQATCRYLSLPHAWTPCSPTHLPINRLWLSWS